MQEKYARLGCYCTHKNQYYWETLKQHEPELMSTLMRQKYSGKNVECAMGIILQQKRKNSDLSSKKENPKPTALKWHTSSTKYNLSQIDKAIQILNTITKLQSRNKNSEDTEMEAKRGKNLCMTGRIRKS